MSLGRRMLVPPIRALYQKKEALGRGTVQWFHGQRMWYPLAQQAYRIVKAIIETTTNAQINIGEYPSLIIRTKDAVYLANDGSDVNATTYN